MESTELQTELRSANDQATQFLAQASRAITNAEEYARGADFLKAIKRAQKDLADRKATILRPLAESERAVRAQFRAPEESLSQAESALKRGMLAFQRAEEEKRLAAQRGAEELARKERERLARLAAKAEQRGAAEKAAEFAVREAAIVAPIVPIAAPKAVGVAIRKDYTFEITDLSALPREYLAPDETKIRKVVRAMGADTNIPGVRVIEREILAARASP